MPVEKKKCECKPKPKGPTKLQLFLSKKKPAAKKPLEGGVWETRQGTTRKKAEENKQQYEKKISSEYAACQIKKLLNLDSFPVLMTRSGSGEEDVSR